MRVIDRIRCWWNDVRPKHLEPMALSRRIRKFCDRFRWPFVTRARWAGDLARLVNEKREALWRRDMAERAARQACDDIASRREAEVGPLKRRIAALEADLASEQEVIGRALKRWARIDVTRHLGNASPDGVFQVTLQFDPMMCRGFPGSPVGRVDMALLGRELGRQVERELATCRFLEVPPDQYGRRQVWPEQGWTYHPWDASYPSRT